MLWWTELVSRGTLGSEYEWEWKRQNQIQVPGSRWRRWLHVEQKEWRSLSVCAETVCRRTEQQQSTTDTKMILCHRDDGGRDIVCDSGADLRAVHTAALTVVSTCWSFTAGWSSTPPPSNTAQSEPLHTRASAASTSVDHQDTADRLSQTPFSPQRDGQRSLPSDERKRDNRRHKSVYRDSFISCQSVTSSLNAS